MVVDRARLGESDVADLARDLEARADIVAVTPAVTSPDSAITVFDAIPAFGPTDERTGEPRPRACATSCPPAPS